MQLNARIQDENGNTLTGFDISWTSSDPAVATVGSSGRITANSDGATQITAAWGGIRASITVTVARSPALIVISPNSVLLTAIGESIAVTVSVLDANDSVIENVPLTWTSNDPNVATVDNQGVITAQMNGETRVTVNHGDISASVTVTVAVEQRAVRIAVMPESVLITEIGESIVVTVTVLDANDSEIENVSLTWTSDDPSVATVDGQGVITAQMNGETNVTVTHGDLSASVSVTVAVEQRAQRIVVMPESVLLTEIGESIVVTVTVLDANDSVIENVSLTWMSDDPSVATVDNQGVITARKNGETRVNVTYGDISASVAVTVAVEQLAVRIAVMPNSVLLTAIGESIAVTVSVLDANDSVIENVPLTWTSDDPSVATVDGQGVITAQMNGETSVTVTHGELSASVAVTVAVEQRAVRIAVMPESVLLTAIGESIVVTVSVLDANDSVIENVPLTWTSDDPSVSTVDGQGVITAQMIGETRVTVNYSDISASVTVTVAVEQRAVRIAVMPESVLLTAIGESIVVTVSVLDANDSEIENVSLTWTSDDPNVATVDGQGVITAQMNGETRVNVTDGNLSASVTVTVAVVQPAGRIVVSPTSVDLTSIGQTIELTASVLDAEDMEITEAVLAWTSEDPAVATVDGQGVVTAQMNGETRVTVSWEALSANVSVVVDQEAFQIVVAQQFVHLPSIGDMTELAATVLDANDVVIPDAELTWSSEDPAVASVDDQGVVTAHMEGVTSITVTSGALSTSVRITVVQQTNLIVVSPESVDMTAIGETIQLIAMLFDMENREIPGAELTWTSADTTVSTVSNQGVVTAHMNGQTLVTVSWEDVSASVTVTVEQQVYRVLTAPQTVHLAAVGDTLTLYVLAIDANEMEISNPVLTWTSEDTTVATVDVKGVVTARMEGVTLVTVTSGDHSAHVSVIVEMPTTFVLSTKSVRLTAIGDTVYPTAKVLDAHNQEISGPRDLTWASKDPTVATVDDYGGITAQMNGQTIVTVTWEDLSDSISVTVAQQADDIVITPGFAHLSTVGETIQLDASVVDANDVEIAGAEVTWTSDNPSVVSVDDRGLVTAEMTGKTHITVTSASVTYVVAVGEVSTDRASLVHFYNVTDGPNWQNNTNWLTDQPLEQWHGIDVDSTGRVTEIWLLRNSLRGHIPTSLASMSHLKFLNLTGNKLSGQIPAALSSLSRLEFLRLANNELSGEIPTEFGNLTSLKRFDLSINELSGGIPSSLGELSDLVTIDLQINQLTGAIPSTLGNLTNLAYLRLGGNPLSGPIPSSIGRLDKLERLFLSQAGLTGVIPSEFGGLVSLKELHMSHNNLSGAIPAGLGNLEHLVSLDLRDNAGLTGPLPRTFVNLNLLSLHLFGTQVCAPRDLEFQEWLFSFHSRYVLNCEAGPDLAGLEALYNFAGGANWSNNTNWRSAEPISSWYGVSVDDSARVVGLSFADEWPGWRCPHCAERSFRTRSG